MGFDRASVQAPGVEFAGVSKVKGDPPEHVVHVAVAQASLCSGDW